MRVIRFDSAGECAAFARGIVYFHVFRGAPDHAMCDAIARQLGRSESFIGIDAEESAGLIGELEIACEIPNVGAFHSGAFIDVTENVEGVSAVMANARRLYGTANREDN